MNEIEQMFYKAYEEICNEYDENQENPSIHWLMVGYVEIHPVIGIYKADFCIGKCLVEIDGHDFHKTKEQREHDYKKERYYLRNGYIPVRFTGTEVFLQPKECVLEVAEIAYNAEISEVNLYQSGIDYAREKAGDKTDA